MILNRGLLGDRELGGAELADRRHMLGLRAVAARRDHQLVGDARGGQLLAERDRGWTEVEFVGLADRSHALERLLSQRCSTPSTTAPGT
jgi:hypothetical protein